MFIYEGKTVLITGASSGIGEAFARELAQRKMNIILVARSEQKLQNMAANLMTKFRINADIIIADLTQEGSAQRIYNEIKRRHLSIDLLINNAGFGTYGPFEAIPAERKHAEVMLNVVSLVDMTHTFLPELLERRGGIINLASIASFTPMPYMSVYAATKAFILSFSEALWGEYHHRGLRILALCPSATETSFFDDLNQSASTKEPAIFSQKRRPEQVVATALRALEQGKCYTVDGGSNYIVTQLYRFFPRSMTIRGISKMMR
ncbi:SDR family NAD(P)-dependent oxidoreductase [Tengunoibacter tsumagoiensis]|uniref:Short-chain dehydrogenase n=1 Tax=Tengunoibacter tsumagoiensis TaxID=2014871 RepID=A0A402A123_9CHLR|nr:SDR family oxidoreductase [Tengunoibacter tsumagoiensis]GCE12860.1 short-chain dehydrogenase [Tengunoibacter tsumagoiensis]